MSDAGPTAVLPMRPLTVGELLDSAVLLFRHQARTLLPVAVGLAASEQLLLYPLRLVAGVAPPGYLPDFDNLSAYWLLLAVGAACEITIIALLGNVAARAAGALLVDPGTPVRGLLRPAGARYGPSLAAAAIGGLLMFLAALVMPAWVVAVALLGGLTPAVVLDRVGPFRALGRSVSVALRISGRAAGIRVLGYLVWWILRVGLAIGVFAGLDGVGLLDPTWIVPFGAVLWTAINAVAYNVLACLDAVVYLETRIRTEGMDIAIAQARRTGRLRTAPSAADQ
ncbi:hypothetical protein [Plantactinospora sonchi]|uniref:Glycerophosphoryl diester phosphodiesterase membrane domain-containing protein n=1 Tax=Plantactinospora sonchi TaxID=1544735 RepID=A0ABU7RLA5_9ACTN